MKEAKKYLYIQDLQVQIVEACLLDKKPPKRKRPLTDDPRRISSTIAKVPPPPTAQLVKEKKLRFGKNVQPQTQDSTDASDSP